jgi:hypothetical protein
MYVNTNIFVFSNIHSTIINTVKKKIRPLILSNPGIASKSTLLLMIRNVMSIHNIGRICVKILALSTLPLSKKNMYILSVVANMPGIADK